jgi:hypothetical protein
MNGNQDKQSNLVDTTDCLEAVGVCRGWKTFLLIIVALCLLVLQISFWLVNTGYVKAEAVETVSAEGGIPSIKELDVSLDENETGQTIRESEEVEKAAEKVATAEPNSSEQGALQSQKTRFFDIKLNHINGVVRFCNFVLILAAMLYCLTLLFCLKISLIGRLGGINHICRAFFISLIMLILLLPWQRFFGGVVVGAIYTPAELDKWCTAESTGIFDAIFHYLRFTGYWLLIILLLIFSQIRSSRWTKAILRRLEVL